MAISRPGDSRRDRLRHPAGPRRRDCRCGPVRGAMAGDFPPGPARTRCSRIFPGRPVSRPSSGICLRKGFRVFPPPSEGQGFPLPLVNLPPPADRNTQGQYAAGQVSGVSGASAPGRAGQYFTDAEIRDLYCPYNPVEKDFIVLGICTKGGTSPGDDLPDLYGAAGVEMRCHSCGNPLTGDNLYRDHQPPTNLRKQFFLFQSYNGNPPGETGKIRQILDYVCTHPLPLYEFECIIIKDGGAKRLRCQTNHLETARKLALGPIRTVNYGENFEHQYLYPHCCACSNTQGKKLW